MRKVDFIVLFSFSILLSACSPSLPKCNSRDVEGVMKEIIVNRLFDNQKFLAYSILQNESILKEVKEISSDKKEQKRICKAILEVKSKNVYENINYEIIWNDRKNRLFSVEILPY